MAGQSLPRVFRMAGWVKIASANYVCLKRRDGGWLVLPGTGQNSLSVRNTIHAWIKAGQ